MVPVESKISECKTCSVEHVYYQALSIRHSQHLSKQADLHFLRQQQQQDQSFKGASGGKLSPLKPVNPIVTSIAAAAKQPVRATASLPVTGPPPTPSSKLVHQGSLDATLLSVQTNIPEMDESGSSTSSGVRSPSFYGFK